MKKYEVRAPDTLEEWEETLGFDSYDAAERWLNEGELSGDIDFGVSQIHKLEVRELGSDIIKPLSVFGYQIYKYAVSDRE